MSDDAYSEALQCPICFTLPEGEVHQCTQGHSYCVTCWRSIVQPRRCPECRESILDVNRNRVQERAVAAIPWTCGDCGGAMTRGSMVEHQRTCPETEVFCPATELGCGWTGRRAGQAEHEAACPFILCQRVVAAKLEPLEDQCRGLRNECAALHRESGGGAELPSPPVAVAFDFLTDEFCFCAFFRV